MQATKKGLMVMTWYKENVISYIWIDIISGIRKNTTLQYFKLLNTSGLSEKHFSITPQHLKRIWPLLNIEISVNKWRLFIICQQHALATKKANGILGCNKRLWQCQKVAGSDTSPWLKATSGVPCPVLGSPVKKRLESFEGKSTAWTNTKSSNSLG